MSDPFSRLTRSYGVLFMDKGFSLRGSFLIGPTGLVRHVTMNEPPVGRSVDEALRVLQAFKSVDENGEVCAATERTDFDSAVELIRLRTIISCLGVPSQLEAWQGHDEGRRGQVQGVLQKTRQGVIALVNILEIYLGSIIH